MIINTLTQRILPDICQGHGEASLPISAPWCWVHSKYDLGPFATVKTKVTIDKHLFDGQNSRAFCGNSPRVNRISEYWEEPYSKWGNTDTWDHYFIEKIPDATRHESHSALGAELEALIRTLKPGTRASRKALTMQRDLKVSVLWR